LVAIAVIGALIGPYYCAAEEVSGVKTIEGEVVLTDQEQSVLTVKWLKSAEGAEKPEYKERTFSVPEGLKISKGADIIRLMDMGTGDHVIVEYEERPEGITVRSVTVKE
jgi:hypothetical protein